MCAVLEGPTSSGAATGSPQLYHLVWLPDLLATMKDSDTGGDDIRSVPVLVEEYKSKWASQNDRCSWLDLLRCDAR